MEDNLLLETFSVKELEDRVEFGLCGGGGDDGGGGGGPGNDWCEAPRGCSPF